MPALSRPNAAALDGSLPRHAHWPTYGCQSILHAVSGDVSTDVAIAVDVASAVVVAATLAIAVVVAMLITVAFALPAADMGVVVAATVAVDMWSRAVGVGGVAFKMTARDGGRDRLQQQHHRIN